MSLKLRGTNIAGSWRSSKHIRTINTSMPAGKLPIYAWQLGQCKRLRLNSFALILRSKCLSTNEQEE